MADIPSELAYQYHIPIWWDPGPDGPWGPNLPQETQRQAAAVSLQARAQILKVASDAYAKIGSLVAGAPASGG
jgi:hypothetical protein